MVSFLTKCPDCGNLIAKDSACGNCGSCALAADGTQLLEYAVEYDRRKKLHTKNYAIYMSLTIFSALCGAISAGLWYRVMMGSVGALLMMGVLAGVSMLIAGLAHFSKSLFPFDLNCPACGERIDEVGLNGSCCPACDINLRY